MGDFLTSDVLLDVYQDGDSDPDAQAELLISMAEASVRLYCGWNITEETVTDAEFYPLRHQSRLFLPTLHLTEVASVTENGTQLDASVYRVRREGWIERPYSWWLCLPDPVMVTYTHGYPAGAPELLVVQQVVASVVSRLADHGDPVQTSAQTGGIIDQFAAPPQVPSGLLYHEQASLDALRLRTVR